MDIRDLVGALADRDALRARQWVADAKRAGFDWAPVTAPPGLDPLGLALAAALVEPMAERSGVEAPSWTRDVPAAPERVFLVRAAESLPRLRRLCEEGGRSRCVDAVCWPRLTS